jgi:heterodisulfide reductase subunit C
MTHAVAHETTFADKIKHMSGEDVAKCYQCGKCTAGCPMAYFMDITPNQMMHLAHLGDPESIAKLLSSRGIWCCVSCETCSTRCPKEVQPSRVIDALRELSRKENKISPEIQNVVRFHRAFLDSVWYAGRMKEVVLVADYKMRSMTLFKDVLLAPSMVFKGKLHFIPWRIKGVGEVRKIFDKCLK